MRKLYNQPQLEIVAIISMNVLMLSADYSGLSVNVNTNPTPDGATAF